jgi:hypothetical protein
MIFNEAIDELENRHRVRRKVWPPTMFLKIEGTIRGLPAINKYDNGKIIPWPEYPDEITADDWVVVSAGIN